MSPPILYSFRLLFSCLFLLVPPPATAGAVVTAPSDVVALGALKAAVAPRSIPPWSCLASWNFSSDPCAPRNPSHFLCGLVCATAAWGSSQLARVVAVSLDPAGYSGPLDPRLFSALTRLTHLELGGNAFSGPVPAALPASLRTLVLSSNAFSGPIPPSLSHLPSLETLDLSRNALSGPIPESLSSLANLRALDLSYNGLTGSLPDALPPSLVELALRGNSLSGALRKSTFGKLLSLEVAELAANRFEGDFEGWFLQLPALQQVDLANNSLTGLEVWAAGEGAGDRLVAVDLGFNRIDGALPPELAGFPALTALSVRHNRLRGAIPLEYAGAKKGAPFGRLFFDGNFLNGKVPEGLILEKELVGSFGDNCLQSCPPAAASLCSPAQKPDWVCKQIYGVAGGREGRSLPQS